MGGLPRRATAIAQFVKENPNTIIVDSGNLTEGAGSTKLDIVASAMAKMGYVAVGVGDRDARLGADFYDKMAAHKLTVVDSSPGADKSAVPFVLRNVGGVKVGIISFGYASPGVKVDDMELRKARFSALKDARSKCDVLILLDQAGVAKREWIERNCPRLGTPDVIIRGFADSTGNDEEEVVARAHIMPALYQGKQIGVVDLEVEPNVDPKVTLNRVTLDDKYTEEPELLKQINDAMAAAGLAPNTSTVQGSPTHVITPPAVYSPNLCKACHLKQYEDWAQTKHAKALQTLVDAKKTTPDCLPCHSQRFRTTGQYVVDNGVGGVDCMTCHSASLPHGMERKAMAARSAVQPAICLQCHTKEHSPTYDQNTYFPKVAHAQVIGPATASVPSSK